MVKFSEIVKTERSGCKKCLTFIYTLPYQVDKNIVGYLKSFGNPLYPLKTVTLIRIDSKDEYHIESRLNKNVIKFLIPKKFDGKNLDKETRKLEFERCLVSWMENKSKTEKDPIGIKIELGEK